MNLARLVLIATASMLATLDVVLYATGRETFSQVIWGWTDQSPMVPLVAGVLIGHLFWPRRIESTSTTSGDPYYESPAIAKPQGRAPAGSTPGGADQAGD